MPHAWRTVRVFISSTFRDMQAERDHLVRFVFPRLREALLKRRIHLVDVDLRWGVTSEQDALEVVREVIDECRPRFLCIVGGRYGWMPPGWERSTLAEEIQYGVLDRPGDHGHAFFYFRDPSVTSVMEAAHPEFREPGGTESKWKLDQLKRTITEAGLNPFIYSARWDSVQERLVGLEEFGERVYADIMRSIHDEFGSAAPEAYDQFAEERSGMEEFVEERTQHYVTGSRGGLLDRLMDFALGQGEPRIAAVTGPPGCGKSALVGKFYRDYVAAHPDGLVVAHFVGATARSTSLRRTLRRLCHELSASQGEHEQIPEDMQELEEKFPHLLSGAANSRRVLLILDGLDEIDPAGGAHSLDWLPLELPANVRVVASSSEHQLLANLRRRFREIQELRIGPLMPSDARSIVEGRLRRWLKTMEPAQMEALLGKTDASLPLYLVAALEELRTAGTNEECTESIRSLPGQIQPLFLWILNRLKADPEFHDREGRPVGVELIPKFFSLLDVSRHGLSERELNDLVTAAAPQDGGATALDEQGNVAALLSRVRPYLMQRGELIDFRYSPFREAVDRELLDRNTALARHREIALYLARQPIVVEAGGAKTPNLRKLSELPYHAREGDLPDTWLGTMTDFGYLEAVVLYLDVGSVRAPEGKEVPWHGGYYIVDDEITAWLADPPDRAEVQELICPLQFVWRQRHRDFVKCPAKIKPTLYCDLISMEGQEFPDRTSRRYLIVPRGPLRGWCERERSRYEDTDHAWQAAAKDLIFISHSSEDRASAELVCHILEQEGLRCWIAPRDVPPGSDWGEQIIVAIENCTIMVLLLSGNANVSPFVKSEVERAFSKRKTVCAFRLQNIKPARALELFIAGSQWFDAWIPPLEERARVLAAALKGLIGTGGASRTPGG